MMSWKRWLAVLLFVIAYLLFGGAVFMALESPDEIDRHREIRNLRTEIYEAFVWNNISLDHASREELLGRLVSASSIGSLIGQDDPPLRWNMFNSFFFAVTVTTTIGYGHMAPSTSAGRIFCIVFALIGIPVNGILLANLGDYFGAKLIKRSRLWTHEKRSKAKLELFLYVLLYLIPGVVIFLMLPAGLFVMVEGWAYLDAFYYSFISLTTIGFGDFVAGQNEGEAWLWIYRTALILWIVFGIGFLVMVINVITRGLKSKPVKNLERKILSTTRLADAKKLRSLINEIAVLRVKPVYRNRSAHKAGTLVRTGSQPFLSDIVTTQSSEGAEANPRPPLARRSSDTALNEIDRGATFALHPGPPMHTENVQVPDDEEDPVRLLARLANHLAADEEKPLPCVRDVSDADTDEDTSWEKEAEIFYMEGDEENVIPAASDNLPRRRFFRFTSVYEEQEITSPLPLPPEGIDQVDIDLAQGRKPAKDAQTPDDGTSSQETTIVSGCCNTEPLFGSVQAWIGSRNTAKSMESPFSHPAHNNSEFPKKALEREVSVRSNFFRKPASLFGSLLKRSPQVQPVQSADPVTAKGLLTRNNLSLCLNSTHTWDERLSVSSCQLNEIGRHMVNTKPIPPNHGSNTFCCRHHGAPCPRTTAAEFAQLLNAVRETRRLQQRKISQTESQCHPNFIKT